MTVKDEHEHTDPATAEQFTDKEAARIARYAAGERRILLIARNVDDAAWEQRMQAVESALETACALVGLDDPARALRLHSGRGGRYRVQRWRIPSPAGPDVLEKLADQIVVSGVLDQQTDVIADD